MPAVEATNAVGEIDVLNGGHDAKGGTCVLGEMRVAGLDEDFDSVEGSDDRLGLSRQSVSTGVGCMED